MTTASTFPGRNVPRGASYSSHGTCSVTRRRDLVDTSPELRPGQVKVPPTLRPAIPLDPMTQLIGHSCSWLIGSSGILADRQFNSPQAEHSQMATGRSVYRTHGLLHSKTLRCQHPKVCTATSSCTLRCGEVSPKPCEHGRRIPVLLQGCPPTSLWTPAPWTHLCRLTIEQTRIRLI